MSKYIKQVKEFMVAAEQPVFENPIDINENRNKLRIALIFEELKEYAEASGELEYFVEKLCVPTSTRFSTQDDNVQYVPIIDRIEQLDALADLQYVLSGAIIEHGFTNIFDEAFDLVHESNMSKFDEHEDDAKITQDIYEEQNIETYYSRINGWYVTFRKKDNKVLKSHKYNAVNLKPLLTNGT